MSKFNNNELKSLIEIAKLQGNKINLSTIMITTKCDIDDLTEIENALTNESIEILNEDIEPDYDDNDNSDKINVVPFDPTQIDIKMDKITIDLVVKRIKLGELKFDSDFQRKSGLWKNIQKSRLIESLMLKIPLPAFYFDASNDDNWEIIDGLQRLSTIKEFIVDEKFALKGLEFLKDLNGLRYSQLPRSLQRRIEETNLNVYLVSPSTPKNVKFNIFKRINTGGLLLEPQEIRNALYQGQATNFLSEMAKNKEFINATDNCIKTDRMLDREFCLRFVSFVYLDINEFNGSVDDWLVAGMEFLSKATYETLNNIKENFSLIMKRSNQLFGKFAFRKIIPFHRRGPINKAIFEGVSVVLNKMPEDSFCHIIALKDKLFLKYENLVSDYKFQSYLRNSDKYSVINRIQMLESIFKEVLGDNL